MFLTQQLTPRFVYTNRTVFSLSPTGPGLGAGQESGVPTILAQVHLTPRISPSSVSSDSDGNEGLILVPTATDRLGRDAGSPTTLKWGFGPGIPTPDPVLLRDGSSPTDLKWNYGEGVPTPDPIHLTLKDAASPTTLKWNYGPGVPTPDPAMLVEVAGGRADGSSPTTLKLDFQWGKGPDGESPTSLKWNYPPGVPTPDPALLVEVAGPDAPAAPTGMGTPTTVSLDPQPSAWGVEVAPPPTPPGTTGSPVGVDKGSPTNLILKWSECLHLVTDYSGRVAERNDGSGFLSSALANSNAMFFLL